MWERKKNNTSTNKKKHTGDNRKENEKWRKNAIAASRAKKSRFSLSSSFGIGTEVFRFLATCGLTLQQICSKINKEQDFIENY